MNGFTVIDNTTGRYPDCEKIALTEDWAKHLIYCDIDTFAINEDGNLILIDDCGNCAFCPADRFTVVYEKQIPKKPKIHGHREGRLINTISYTCPICNKHIGREDYCKHCGQALDWSDTNE
jgi:hypothetical protein